VITELPRIVAPDGGRLERNLTALLGRGAAAPRRSAPAAGRSPDRDTAFAGACGSSTTTRRCSGSDPLNHAARIAPFDRIVHRARDAASVRGDLPLHFVLITQNRMAALADRPPDLDQQ
jgi:hypothetical protein